MLYTTCKYAPEELFSGFGVPTMRLDPNPVSFSCADGCAHPNLCGFAKAVIEEVRMRDVRELIITDCCDAMRRTYDVLSGQQLDFLWFLPLPHKSGPAEVRMFAKYLKELADAYGKYLGRPFSAEDALAACRTSQSITAPEDAALKDTLPENATSENATSENATSENATPEDAAPCPLIHVLGAHGGQLLLRQVDEVFPGYEVRDETCSGNRHFPAGMAAGPDAADPDAFFLWYADLLLNGLQPCMRMNSSPNLQAHVESAIKKHGDGVVFHTMKFCDYYSFTYADLKDHSKIPFLKIETDTTPQSGGQLRTRIEAYKETLEGLNGSMQSDKNSQKMSQNSSLKNSRSKIIIVAGIDSGSTSTDVVIMDSGRNILGKAIVATGMSASKSASAALEAALREAGLSRSSLRGVAATGYGREIIEMEKQTITEITCHAKGAHFLFPGIRTIIDIGGQDSKVIRIDEEGRVLHFVMNDKCAAGTGRFLEMQAKALGLSMEEMSRLGLSWKEDVRISSMCTVFAESEVISLVAGDTPVNDIIHGLNMAVAQKTESLVRRGKGEPAFAMTGGVSRNAGVVNCLESTLSSHMHISDLSQFCGAIGAALMLL